MKCWEMCNCSGMVLYLTINCGRILKKNCCDLQRDISKAGADGGAPRSEYLFKTSGELVRTGEYSFNTCGELVGICCVMKMMGSFSASIPDPKRQSDDRCVSAEKIMFKWYVRGCLSQ